MDKRGRIYAVMSYFKTDVDPRLHYEKINDYGFAVLDKDLNLIESYSAYEIFKHNKLLSNVYGHNQVIHNPFHLNDVEPYIRKDGSTVVLLSFRAGSTLMALDLDTNNLIWKINNSTSRQHDIDIINSKDETIDISIFDNNSWTSEVHGSVSYGNAYVLFDDLPTSTEMPFEIISGGSDFARYPNSRITFDWLEEKYRPKTISEGRSDYIAKNDSLMIEESNYGRILEIDMKEKKILWQYVNKAKEGLSPLFMLNWSRRLQDLPKGIKPDGFKSCF